MRRQESLRIFVEGGGDNHLTRSRCKQAFCILIERAGFADRMPKFTVCGSRSRAYEMFSTACGLGEESLLLVDSEGPVSQASPWEHVRIRQGDGWVRPPGAREEDLHFMVECMEAWILADMAVLRRKYGQRLQESALPKRRDVEMVPKQELLAGITRATSAADYSKGKQAFELLEAVDPVVLRERCPWAERFFAELDRRTRA
ncbi:MAG: DUF4276 family protein [Nannocystis sp.]|uniref:DUF4276 family protein n=1 Tax=Nannocystis sp. TaxID=1962667 RepID=UPI002429F0E8|nr:DUF4276 family protein [Nannocystis sp.]MBK9756407.1 DUF4276 family protein [Nannocystis sp.]